MFLFAMSIFFIQPSEAQVNTSDKEFAKDWTDCKIFTDAIDKGNVEIANHKINGIFNYVDKINNSENAMGRPTFDLTSTPEKKERLVKQVYMSCLKDPSGVVVDKTISIYKNYARFSDYIVPNGPN